MSSGRVEGRKMGLVRTLSVSSRWGAVKIKGRRVSFGPAAHLLIHTACHAQIRTLDLSWKYSHPTGKFMYITFITYMTDFLEKKGMSFLSVLPATPYRQWCDAPSRGLGPRTCSSSNSRLVLLDEHLRIPPLDPPPPPASPGNHHHSTPFLRPWLI